MMSALRKLCPSPQACPSSCKQTSSIKFVPRRWKFGNFVSRKMEACSISPSLLAVRWHNPMASGHLFGGHFDFSDVQHTSMSEASALSTNTNVISCDIDADSCAQASLNDSANLGS